ncbi:hypothetical protein [Bradyrhizobium sp. 192]|uniref:hypothetical protein n=1 Tax=Bradyrhizobium sp. 192 TaxID=2782660 RepID=UPI00200003CE|nr:hypothetical protein [Bradyrhizobium sp. 192]UPJ55291.1 hypothetical protein IVB24_21715 [Bradyrhizobium sp. 192]
MTIRQRIVDHIARTISAGEAREANILLGLLIANFAGIDGFLDATTAQLGGFLSARYHSAATFARRLSTMRLIYTTLIMWRMLEFNPATDIRRPTVVVHATDFDVSPADVQRLIEAQETVVRCGNASDYYWAHQQRVVLASMYLVASGVLLSELEDLKMRDLGCGILKVGCGTLRERVIWPSNAALEAIGNAAHSTRILPPVPGAPLFVQPHGALLNTKLVSKWFRRAIERADIPGLTPAKIHRSAAKGVLENGLGWDVARNPSGYRRIPKMSDVPSLTDMERAIARHPLESV